MGKSTGQVPIVLACRYFFQKIMRVIEQTHRRLTLRNTPYWLWMLGTGFAAIGMVFGVALFGSTSLRCDRATTQCELTHSNVFGERQRTFSTDSLERAEVDRQRSSDGDSTYRVIIQTQDGEIRLTESTSSGWGRRQQQADQINDFIQDPTQPTLELGENNYLIAIVCFVAFGLAGSAMVLCVQSSTFTFDKTLGKLTLTRSHIFGRRKQEQHPLKQLVGVQLQHSDETCRIVLVLDSGKMLPLTNYYSSGTKAKQKIVDQVCKFLGVRDTSQAGSEEQIFSMEDYRELLRMFFMGTVAEKREMMRTAKAAMEANPDDLDAYVKYGMAAIAQGNRDQAKEMMEQARSRFMQQRDMAKVTQINQAMTLMGLEI